MRTDSVTIRDSSVTTNVDSLLRFRSSVRVGVRVGVRVRVRVRVRHLILRIVGCSFKARNT